jgi:SPP1 gp7 family putative phage head morphogenesis protein
MDREVTRPGRIYEVAAEHRRALLAGEREAAARMVRAYGEAWKRIQSELEYITQRIEEARRAGEEVSAAWLYRQRRWQALREQVLAEVQRFAGQVEESVRAQQAEVVAAAQEHAREQAQAVAQTEEQAARITTTWNRLPAEATEDLVGFLSDGPLRTLLDGLGAEAAAGVERSLLVGLATGQNPRKIARFVRQEFGVPLSRALTISRTEVLRSYRESTRRTYQANSHIIRGWRWLAAHQPRTCPACLAMDGSIHPLEEQLDDHPNGRCAMTPVLVDEEPPARETGVEWFERQDDATQERILGKAGLAAYKAGAVTLQDFVGRRYSEEWGTTRYARSLRQILGPEEALKWRQEAWEKGAERERDH